MSTPSTEKNAQALLIFAHKLAETPGLTWVAANNAVYGPGGPFVRLFPTKADREVFGKTQESLQIDKVIDSLPEPPIHTEGVQV